MVRGAGSAPDHSAAIAKVWLDFAADAVSPWIIRVETASNIADGPTRDFLDHLSLMRAQWVEPVWPTWVTDFWSVEE